MQNDTSHAASSAHARGGPAPWAGPHLPAPVITHQFRRTPLTTVFASPRSSRLFPSVPVRSRLLPIFPLDVLIRAGAVGHRLEDITCGEVLSASQRVQCPFALVSLLFATRGLVHRFASRSPRAARPGKARSRCTDRSNLTPARGLPLWSRPAAARIAARKSGPEGCACVAAWGGIA